MTPHAAPDTIVAIATAAGAGGVGIVRLSGPASRSIAEKLCGRPLRPRHAHHVRFAGDEGTTVDDGIALSFPAPASFTGEDVVELQVHGSPAVLHELVRLCCMHGARRARPGEFSERAFLHGKLDLAQAEAVADLIAAADLQAAQAARRSLEGEFSRRVDAIASALLALRVHVEAMIDFVDEPIETLGGNEVGARLRDAAGGLATLLAEAERGRKLRDGLHVVIVGPPNAGKSSLLNALAGSDRAIVTDIAGTTRDLLQETVRVGGIELTLVDTAGLREGGDAIEREGMRRAQAELQRADLALVVLDARDPEAGIAAIGGVMPATGQCLVVHNKLDLLPAGDQEREAGEGNDGVLRVSVCTGAGLPALEARLHAWMGAADGGEGAFTARQRHVDALGRASAELAEARRGLDGGMLDLSAEALRQAHDALGEITGRVRPDDLLGHIFSTFCIGK
ncbi:tRNA uridine-5-carboxymethylaminomethyl(34) synthesis GTPase MnmE [Luteimonas aestuarii]|uniref:tRNA modification GTPase MnmE n=1 Tax=Luteimonas aestuarii TaxID=453837 RepID=A0A4V3AL97_9GAMM|nr:tRNA uridine-5-carboxymethylaminomethyl(34) synthesis GTPase MnmE [Luteimonas aestuarii]TDK19061.1 tRNA uridine-5-carboxymethylaminomethyl(34) synthesis GTPase MnmE [Luteimonas aestuarii]